MRLTLFHTLSLVVFSLPIIASAAPTARWEISKPECRTGDPVELQIQVTDSQYFELSVQLPEIEGIHTVAKRKAPIQYEKGFYTQMAIWEIQSTKAGKIAFTNANAKLTHEDEVTLLPLPPLELNVVGHLETKDNFQAEPLPSAQESITNKAILVPAIITAISGILIAIFIHHSKRKVVSTPTPHEDTLADVHDLLASGKIPHRKIEQVLANPKVQLTSQARIALEQAIYDRQANPKSLLSKLEEEAHP